MTIVTQPNIIEQSDFSGGYVPDQQEAAAEAKTVQDVMNLLPDNGTSALVTRPGFDRLVDLGLSGYYIKNIFHFRWAGGIAPNENYLIVVVTNEANAVNNVQVWAVKLSDGTAARIDTAGVNWANPTKNHWGEAIQHVWYGGSPGNEVYSWDPDNGWNATANTNPNWFAVVDAIDDNVDTTQERARDFAWKGKELVTYGGDVYTPNRSIRFDTWESGHHYSEGQRVSRKTVWDTTEEYWKSFRCIKKHVAGADSDEPGTGANTATYWEKVRLGVPTNADGDTRDGWYFVPVAPGTNVAEWHADRLWLRYDEQGDKSRLLFSAPLKPDKGMDIPDMVFDMTDFAPGNDKLGPGGGWIPVNDGAHGGVITALRSYNHQLIIWKRLATWVLTGQSEETFSLRRLASGVGCVDSHAQVEHEGLIFFLSDKGLYVTDGTAVEPVQGGEKLAETLEARIDDMHGFNVDIDPCLVSWEGLIYIAMPVGDGNPAHITYVYDPANASWWVTDLPWQWMHKARHEAIPHLYFGAAATYGAGRSIVYTYDEDETTDDEGLEATGSVNIAWNVRTSWWPFGLLREQRRIRRTWALVKGALTYTLNWFRDWDVDDTGGVDTTVTDQFPVFIEGEWFPDSHSVAFELSGTEAPATVYGFGVDTQPRRKRYHVG